MPSRIAGIDVHKKMLAVVVGDVEVDGEFDFDRQTARHDADRLASPRLAGFGGSLLFVQFSCYPRLIYKRPEGTPHGDFRNWLQLGVEGGERA
jgi:hypothetical protein